MQHFRVVYHRISPFRRLCTQRKGKRQVGYSIHHKRALHIYFIPSLKNYSGQRH